MAESSEQFEERAVYNGVAGDRLGLIRTIVAMSNSEGGEILIDEVAGDPAGLEAPALLAEVNRYVAPPVEGLRSERLLHGAVVIRVAESRARPHLFTRAGRADGTGDESAYLFHPGQIWVRHGPANQVVTPEDVQRLVRSAAAETLKALGASIGDPDFGFQVTDTVGVPVRISDREDAVPVDPNLERTYPYTTKTLGAELGRTTNWAARAVKVLSLKESRTYAYGVTSPGGHVLQWRYSERARQALLEILQRNPRWNPYHE